MSGCLGISTVMFVLHTPVCSYLYNGPNLTVGIFGSVSLFSAAFYMNRVHFSQSGWKQKNTLVVAVFWEKNPKQMYFCIGMGSSGWRWKWLVHQDVPFASCVEPHPHRVVQIVPLELQLAHVLEHSQNPHGVSSHCPSQCHSSVTSQASPRPQTWERQDHFHSNAKVKESDEATESLKKNRKAAFNLMDFCPEYSYKKSQRVFSFQEKFFGG